MAFKEQEMTDDEIVAKIAGDVGDALKSICDSFFVLKGANKDVVCTIRWHPYVTWHTYHPEFHRCG